MMGGIRVHLKVDATARRVHSVAVRASKRYPAQRITTEIMSLRSTYTPTAVKGASGERSSSRASAAEAAEKKPKKKVNWSSLPDIWALIHPRRTLLLLGFGLMALNRVAGLVLPGSTKYLVDDVIGKKQQKLLLPLVLTVIAATLIQGLSSFALTQLLSKSAQRMITDLRKQVQAHIGRLSVSFYDANKTGALVSRILSDVEGVRNLIGTGLVEFVGGLMTAVLALGVLLYINAVMTVVAFGVLIVFGLFLNKAFSSIR